MSANFREYLRFGDLQYRHLGDLVVNSASLTDQLRLASDKPKGIKFAEPIYMGPEGLSHRKGGRCPLEMRWTSSGSSPDPQSDETFPDDAHQERPVELKVSGMTVAPLRPGSIALEYHKRYTREWPARHDDVKRSDEQEKNLMITLRYGGGSFANRNSIRVGLRVTDIARVGKEVRTLEAIENRGISDVTTVWRSIATIVTIRGDMKKLALAVEWESHPRKVTHRPSAGYPWI